MYIEPKVRNDLEKLFQHRGIESGAYLSNTSELAYSIARLVDDYVGSRENVTFTTLASIEGMLDLVKIEFSRHRTLQRLDQAEKENGGVFTSLYF